MKHLSVLIVVPLFTDDVKFLILFCLSLAIFPTPQLLISLEVCVLFINGGELGNKVAEGKEVTFNSPPCPLLPCPSAFCAQCPMPNSPFPIPIPNTHIGQYVLKSMT